MKDGMSRAELIELVERIMRAEGATEEESDNLVALFERNVPQPGASDLIFWPPGGVELSAEEIVDHALAYKPIALGPSTTDTAL